MTDTVRQMNAQAPTGRGLSTSPAMVEKKMARSCHAWGVTSTGLGTRKRIASPIATEIASGNGFAPVGGGEGGDGGGGDEEEARIRERRGLWRLGR